MLCVSGTCVRVLLSLSHTQACMHAQTHRAQIFSYKVLQANPSMQATLKMHAYKMFISYTILVSIIYTDFHTICHLFVWE